MFQNGKMSIFFINIILISFYVKSYSEITLTTATIRESTSAKPTTLYRRINVERNFQEKSSTPLDLLRLRVHTVKRSQSKIWNWDLWCQLQPKRGKCSENLIKFYYDTQLDKCLPFPYSGCDGNKNNFDTLVDCERHCKEASYMTLKYSAESICSLQPHAGMCLGFSIRYYYDVNDHKCRTFVYGGCGGNQNRFETKHKCMLLCYDTEQLV